MTIRSLRIRYSSSSNSRCVSSMSNDKPVAGFEPELAANLASFCEQDYPDFDVVGEIAIVHVAVLSEREPEQVRFGLPPPAPPGLNPILRI